MAKLLRFTDRVLLGLSIFGDLLDGFEEIRPTKSKWHTSAYSLFPKDYKKANYSSSISRLLKNDIVEKVVENGQARLRIKSKGKKQVARDFPFLKFQNQKWDRKWRIVVFDISEDKRAKRDSLRSKLKELGFGMLQKSTWISPHNFEDDIYEFFKLNDLDGDAHIFVANKLLVGDVNKLVEKLWNASEINELYIKAKNINDMGMYCLALSKDPFLPRELLPKDWITYL
jgi:phenylacetic acid degradation operon negative regulatory protein